MDLGAPVLDHDPDPDYSLIGGASFIRGVPGQPTLLLRFMPAGKAVPPFDRQWLALVLTSQIFLGAFLGIATQAFLAIVVSIIQARRRSCANGIIGRVAEASKPGAANSVRRCRAPHR